MSGGSRHGQQVLARRPSRTSLGRRRRTTGLVLSVALPAALTLVLVPLQGGLNLVSDMLLFLLVTVVVALVGGMLPALVSAVVGSALLNYWFTPPLHTLSIRDPNNTLALRGVPRRGDPGQHRGRRGGPSYPTGGAGSRRVRHPGRPRVGRPRRGRRPHPDARPPAVDVRAHLGHAARTTRRGLGAGRRRPRRGAARPASGRGRPRRPRERSPAPRAAWRTAACR